MKTENSGAHPTDHQGAPSQGDTPEVTASPPPTIQSNHFLLGTTKLTGSCTVTEFTDSVIFAVAFSAPVWDDNTEEFREWLSPVYARYLDDDRLHVVINIQTGRGRVLKDHRVVRDYEEYRALRGP